MISRWALLLIWGLRSGGILSFAGMGQGAQENISKLINAMQLVKSISGLADDDRREFDKTYESFVNVTATVMGLVDSTQGAIATRSDSYVEGAGKIGGAKDLKGSIDQNSQLQAQNGITINELIGTVNTATMAINQQNLDDIAKQSALSKITKKAVGIWVSDNSTFHSWMFDNCTHRVQPSDTHCTV